MLNQSIKELHEQERKKKLFMKWILNSTRKFFNDRQLSYHPLCTCVSIKPGSENRCATLQSYPNQDVWKYLKDLPEKVRQDLKAHLLEDIKGVENKFHQQLLIEFEKRVQNNFDFRSFYKGSKNIENQRFSISLENDTDEIPQIESEQKDKQVKQKKWSKGLNFVSESKQILFQMQLCNKNPSLIPVNQLHNQKLLTLFEKIKGHQFKCSDDLKQFSNELQKFCQHEFPNMESEIKKKVKKNNDQQQCEKDKIQEIQQFECIPLSQEELLNSFKNRVRSIEPGIQLFIPDLQKVDPLAKHYFQQLEVDFYKELYYKEKVDQMELNPKSILQTWKHTYKPF